MRLLGTALGDEAAARRVLGAALTKAGRDALPDAPAALLAFVRAHLVELLTSRLGARVVAGFLDNLASAVIAAEIEALSKSSGSDRNDDSTGRWQREEPTERWTREAREGALNVRAVEPRRSSVPRMPVAISDPGSPARGATSPRAGAARSAVLPVHSQPIGRPTPPPKKPDDSDPPPPPRSPAPRPIRGAADRGVGGHNPSPARASDHGARTEARFDARSVDGARTASAGAASSAPPPGIARGAVLHGRPSVLVVDTDRYGRSSLSRALVQAGCDVTVVETASEVTGMAGRFHVVIANMASTDVLKTLASLTARYSDVPCVARTREDALTTQHRVHATGLRNVTVVGGALPFSMLVDHVRRLAGGVAK